MREAFNRTEHAVPDEMDKRWKIFSNSLPNILKMSKGVPIGWGQIVRTDRQAYQVELGEKAGLIAVKLKKEQRLVASRENPMATVTGFPNEVIWIEIPSYQLPINEDQNNCHEAFFTDPANTQKPLKLNIKNYSNNSEEHFYSIEEIQQIFIKGEITDLSVLATIYYALISENKLEALNTLKKPEKTAEYPQENRATKVQAELLAIFDEKFAYYRISEGIKERVVSVMSGEKSAPGMAVNLRISDSGIKVAVFDQWRDFAGEKQGNWVVEIPGGASSPEIESNEEYGRVDNCSFNELGSYSEDNQHAQLIRGIWRIIPENIKRGEKKLDITEKGRIRNSRFVNMKMIEHYLLNHCLDGRTAGLIFALRLLRPELFIEEK